MKTQDLIGPALDWAVAKCGGWQVHRKGDKLWIVGLEFTENGDWQPSTDWSQGGPIIEREKISLVNVDDESKWGAVGYGKDMSLRMLTQRGPTPLIAAMRCYCSAKLGDEVEVPDDLAHL